MPAQHPTISAFHFYHGRNQVGAALESLRRSQRSRVKREYQLLFSPKRGRRRGPKGPAKEELPVSRWHEQIGDPALTDGILDWMIHNAHRIEMRGHSVRKNRGKSGT
jgi:hypothetical protein